MEGIDIAFGAQGMIITVHVDGVAPRLVLTPIECLTLGIDGERIELMRKYGTVFHYPWTEERIPQIEKEVQ